MWEDKARVDCLKNIYFTLLKTVLTTFMSITLTTTNFPPPWLTIQYNLSFEFFPIAESINGSRNSVQSVSHRLYGSIAQLLLNTHTEHWIFCWFISTDPLVHSTRIEGKDGDHESLVTSKCFRADEIYQALELLLSFKQIDWHILPCSCTLRLYPRDYFVTFIEFSTN